VNTPSSEADGAMPVALRWMGDDGAAGRLEVLDQTALPTECRWNACPDVAAVVEAIKSLRVRGAPAIGIAGAYGMAVAAGEAVARRLDPRATRELLAEHAESLASARPTAVNLRWAVDRCRGALADLPATAPAEACRARLLDVAREIHEEDRRLCAAIGAHGADRLPPGDVLTHCNTGCLATGGAGTALAVITTAWDRGRRFMVYADETRPLFQGARLTAWELAQRGVPVTVLVDAAAGHLLATGRIAACIVGADRIAANGDTANKIGTYALAVLAAAHGVPFFVAAPSSTFDLSLADGGGIPIEQRAAAEVLAPFGTPVAPAGVAAFNPAFDVTPARLIRGIVTERGVVEPVTRERVAAVLAARGA